MDEKIDWEKYDEQFLSDIKKMQNLEKQVELEREAESKLVDSMTKQQRIEYLKQKCIRANQFAKENNINQKIIVSKGKKGE